MTYVAWPFSIDATVNGEGARKSEAKPEAANCRSAHVIDLGKNLKIIVVFLIYAAQFY